MRDTHVQRIVPMHTVITGTYTQPMGYQFDPPKDEHPVKRWVGRKVWDWLLRQQLVAMVWQTHEVRKFWPPNLERLNSPERHAMLIELERIIESGGKPGDFVLVMGPYVYASLVGDQRAADPLVNGRLDLRWEQHGNYRYHNGRWAKIFGVDIMLVNHIDGWALLPKWVVYKERPRVEDSP